MRLKFSFENNKIVIDIHDEDKQLLKELENGVHFIGTYFRLTYMSKYNSHTKYLLYFLIKESDDFPITFTVSIS